MVSNRDNFHVTIGARLVQLREEKGLTQKQFAEEFSVFCGASKPVTVPTVSSWELNRRLPSVYTLLFLAQYHGVTLDYITNNSNERHDTKGKRLNKNSFVDLVSYSEVPIKEVDLPKFDHLPVYVDFKNHAHIAQWGILDLGNKKVVCRQYVFGLTANIVLYPYQVQSPLRPQISQMSALKTAESIIVKMKSSDPEVYTLYDGRYRNNEDKTALINIANGLVLPYTGLGISYLAYRE